jgi:hypothetical protein
LLMHCCLKTFAQWMCVNHKEAHFKFIFSQRALTLGCSLREARHAWPNDCAVSSPEVVLGAELSAASLS